MALLSFLCRFSFTLLMDFVYPPLCLHCGGNVTTGGQFLCVTCGAMLSLLDSSGRCAKCFALIPHQDDQCSGTNIYRSASALEYAGPAATLVKAFKYGRRSYLAEGLGAYLVAQHHALQWPVPDVIIPVPQMFSHWIRRGFNQSNLLACVLGRALGRPVVPALYRSEGDFSQAKMSREQRCRMTSASIGVRRKYGIADNDVLIVDDVMTTGMTVRACAEVLTELCPRRIYVLTVCMAE